MDNRSKWEDYAACLQEDTGVAAENHWEFAEVFPWIALSV
jgi:hypothetical protein